MPPTAPAATSTCRQKALLHAFGSARGVSRAAVEDIAKVAGVSEPLARRIHDHFRKAAG